MATKSAGRVTIRVLPDSTKFREDLKLSLERVEKTMKATIPAELAVTRESIRKLKEQLRDLEVRIKVEPYVTQEQLDDLKNELENIDPSILANLNTLRARQQLLTLTRARTVPIFVRVNTASLAAAASALAALSGARILGNIFDTFWNSIKNLDRNAPRIAAISSGIIGLGGAVLALVSNLGGLIGSLIQLSGISLFLPAILSGMAIAIGTAVVVLKDMKTVLADLAPAFHELQDNMSAAFWQIAEQPIRQLVEALLPALNEQLVNTSQALGVIFREISDSFRKYITPAYLNQVFDNLNQGINHASRGVDGMVKAFAILGRVGSSYLPRLGTFLADIGTQFGNFIAKAEASGELKRWADNAIQSLKDLGKVIYETARVFGALARAAERAGGAGFAELAGGLKKLADLMNTENFQVTFATIFAGAHLLMDGLIDGLDRLGVGLAKFAPTLQVVFSEVGKILGQFLENIGEFLADPVLQQGLKDFFSGFKTFMTDLKPAMGPLGRIIGTLATAVGSLLSQMGPLITEVAENLAPMFEELWKTIQPLIPDLIKLTEVLIEELAPILMTFIKEVLPPLIPLLADMLPVMADLLKAASPVIIKWFEDLGLFLEAASPHMQTAAKWLGEMSTALKGFPLALFQAGTGDKGGLIQSLTQIAIDHPEIPAFFSALNVALGGVFDKIEASAETVTGVMNGFNTGIILLTSPEGIPSLVGAFGLLFQVEARWNIFWTTLVGVVEGLMPRIGVPVNRVLLEVALYFQQLFNSLPKWTGFWGSLPAPAGIAMSLVAAAVRLNIPGIILNFMLFINQTKINLANFWRTIQINAAIAMSQFASAISRGFPSAVTFVVAGMLNLAIQFARGWEAIRIMIPGWFARMAFGVSMGIQVVVQRATGLPGQVTAALLGYAWQFASAGTSLIQSFASGITGGTPWVVSAAMAVVKAVTDLLPGSPAKRGPLSGRGYSLLRGQRMMEDFSAGIKSRTELTRKTMGDIVTHAQLPTDGVSFASAASGAVGTSGGALVHIDGDYYGATPERVADEFDKKLRRANLAAQLSKVVK